MKRILFILSAVSIPVFLLAAEPVREWKDNSGRTIRASYDPANDSDPATVPLIKNGKPFNVQFKKLSQADQEYVTKARQSKRDLDDDIGLEISIPKAVEDVKINEYKVVALNIRLPSSDSTLPMGKILAGKIQLPPIPKKIHELTGSLRGIEDTLTQVENGTHEALLKAEQVKIDAQAQYEVIKLRRDEEWKTLPTQTQKELERQIMDSPTSKLTSFVELKPEEVNFSQFVKLVLWGQKTEQARLEKVRVENAIEEEVQNEINRIKTTRDNKKQELQLETEKFRQAVVQFILEQTPNWKKSNESEEMDYVFLSEMIPGLRKYPFGWEEESLFSLAEDVWKTKRPCVMKAEVQKHNLSIPGTIAGERKTVTVNDVEFAFRWCPQGTFTMGSPESEEGRNNDETQHKVTLPKGFWMLETEVTVGMFKAFVNDTGYVCRGNTPIAWGYLGKKRWGFRADANYSWFNPGFSPDDNYPVSCVSWYDAAAFCFWLGRKTKQNISLPTEAQWEYACRAGSTGARAGNQDDMAWYQSNSGNKSHPVGTKKPNAWGLYDMHGNVWEWCADRYGKYPGKNSTKPTASSSGANRVRRGCSWSDRDCRSALRTNFEPAFRASDSGFRVVRGQ